MVKKVSKKKDAELAELRKGAVNAVEFLEKIDGPLTLGRLLNAIRQCDGGLSLATMATKLGVSRQHLHDIEKGTRAVSPERAARWARKLGYSESSFVQYALQAQLDAAKIKLRVHIEAA